MLLQLDTGDLLQVDTLADIREYSSARVLGIFNTILKASGSYMQTKQLMRIHYGLFILIVR